MFPVEHPNHLGFLNDEHGGGCNGCRRRHANGLARKAPFTQKIARSKDSPLLVCRTNYNSKLHTAFLDVHHTFCDIALREDGFFSSKRAYLPS